MAAGIGACPLSPPADIPDARTAHTTTIGTCTDHGAAEWQATMEALILVATFGWRSRRSAREGAALPAFQFRELVGPPMVRPGAPKGAGLL